MQLVLESGWAIYKVERQAAELGAKKTTIFFWKCYFSWTEARNSGGNRTYVRRCLVNVVFIAWNKPYYMKSTLKLLCQSFRNLIGLQKWRSTEFQMLVVLPFILFFLNSMIQQKRKNFGRGGNAWWTLNEKTSGEIIKWLFGWDQRSAAWWQSCSPFFLWSNVIRKEALRSGWKVYYAAAVKVTDKSTPSKHFFLQYINNFAVVLILFCVFVFGQTKFQFI